MKMNRWIWMMAVALTGCAGMTPSEMYEPSGLRGEEYCETTGACVIKTDTGEAHLVIGDQSAMTVSFVGTGGDVDHHYYDFLITIKNIGETTLHFDPGRIPGYDSAALLEPFDKQQEELMGLAILSGISSAIGGQSHIAQIQYLDSLNRDERRMAEEQFADQKIVTQMIAPEETTGGRIIVRPDTESSDAIFLTIPVGNDRHTVRFRKIQ